MTDLFDRIAYVATDKISKIDWPDGFVPTVVHEPRVHGGPVPKADILVITYTYAEGQALADVLSPGFPSENWTYYTNEYKLYESSFTDRSPARSSKRLGSYAVITIGSLRILLFKSELHPATDGPTLPMSKLWIQLLNESGAKFAITTGTAGGIGPETSLGDVLVTNSIHWDATGEFKDAKFAHERYVGPEWTPGRHLNSVTDLLGVNASHLRPVAKRNPIVRTSGDVITCDAFLFDDAEDTYGLRTYDPSAWVEEMDDGALPVALASPDAPSDIKYLSIRNASDPQIPQMKSVEVEKQAAAKIYKQYGYWTTTCSAIAVWAVIADLT